MTHPPAAGLRLASAFTRLLVGTCLVLGSGALALVAAQPLPPQVEAALALAKLPREAISVLVVDAEGKAPPRLQHRAQASMNPASVMKLVTTYAALDTLGPAYTWSTPVFAEGSVSNGVLTGKLTLRGQGDPKLVIERLWLLLRRVQALGITTIAGDIVLDRSAFETVATDPGEFDGERLRPYNAAPDALLINFKSVVMSFVPDRARGLASVSYEPALAGVAMSPTVALSSEACADYRASLKAEFSAERIRFGGSYPASCGEKVWPVAYADPKTYASRAVEAMWREMGGKLTGKVRERSAEDAKAEAKTEVKSDAKTGTAKPTLEATSPALAEIIRDINKYSNNLMAQQVFLTLSLQARGSGTLEGSRELVRQWWRERLGDAPLPELDNGSGLSRSERISAQSLAKMLQHAWASPLMPELLASLPVAGVDGTLKRSKSRLGAGTAHLKTGSLRDVAAVAGFVHAASGKRYVLIAIANHPNASAARPAFDALLDWAVDDK